MNILPEIDIVILAWNRPELTLQAINSVQRQTGVQCTIWVVDQGSDPHSRDILRPLADRGEIRLIELDDNVGVAAGRNVGMAHGRAPFIVVLDNDTELDSGEALCRVAARFEADMRLGAVGFYIQDARTGEYDRPSWAYPRALFARRNEAFLATRYCGAGHALRREALSAVEGYDEDLFFYWEELDLSYQLIAEGYTILYDPSIVVRHHRATDQRVDWKSDRYYYLVRNALYLSFKYFCAWRWVLILAAGYLAKGVVNGIPLQAVAGIRDALGMIRRLGPSDLRPLPDHARQYIRQHDIRHRGSLANRFFTEVLERLG